MSLWRLTIMGALVLAAIYMVASAVAALVPYVMGAFLVVIVFTALQRWLSSMDASSDAAASTRTDEAP